MNSMTESVSANFDVIPFLSGENLSFSFPAEEGLGWREDRTNHDGELLRSKMRQKLMPHIDEIFPNAVQSLVVFALAKQKEAIFQE